MVERTAPRSNGIAVWRQIADVLREDVLAGRFDTGKLPPEAALAERFGVNRHTLRRALAAMAAEGLVRSDQGKGTFVSGGRLSYPIGRRTRFSEIIGRQAREPGGRLIASSAETADARLADLLGLPVGAPVLRLETLSVADAVPISAADSWFPAERFPRLVAAYAETGSITAALARHGVEDYEREWTRITARAASPTEAERLLLSAGGTVLVTEALNVDVIGAPVHFSRSCFAAERIEIVVASDGEGGR